MKNKHGVDLSVIRKGDKIQIEIETSNVDFVDSLNQQRYRNPAVGLFANLFLTCYSANDIVKHTPAQFKVGDKVTWAQSCYTSEVICRRVDMDCCGLEALPQRCDDTFHCPAHHTTRVDAVRL